MLDGQKYDIFHYKTPFNRNTTIPISNLQLKLRNLLVREQVFLHLTFISSTNLYLYNLSYFNKSVFFLKTH